MSEWRNAKLGDVVEIKYGKDHKNLATGNIPAYGSGGVMRYVDSALYDDESILIPRKGSLNNIIFESKPFWTVDTMFWSKIDKTLVFPKFLFYQLTEIDYMNLNVGSAVPSLTVPVINSIDITLPPLEEQISIASVLSSLDDKIDLLHRQNKTLEAMAETLFRQWFVEGAGDWEEGTLADVATNVKDAVTTSSIVANSIYIGLEHIDRRNIALNQNGFGSDVSSNKYAFAENDILFGKLRPYFHKICFAPFQGICSTDILVIRPKKPELFAYCLFAFFQTEVVEYANLGSGGTRMPRTDWGVLKTYPIMIPHSRLIKAFNEIAIPSIEKIASNIQQIKSLEKLRDSLLPKLMSGEMRVV